MTAKISFWAKKDPRTMIKLKKMLLAKPLVSSAKLYGSSHALPVMT
jgi:hypothetical protein